MRKNIITVLIFWLIISIGVTNSQPKNKSFTKIADIPELKNGQWSGYAKYVDGEEILSYKSHYSLAPASGLKAVTSAVGIDLLGSDYTFKTKFYYTGSITTGTLDGNIIIRGGGDPTLGSDLVKTSNSLEKLTAELLKAITDAGIKQINGRIIADNSLYTNHRVPENWFWVDMGNYYGAGSDALTLHDNLYHLFFKPADKVGELAEVLRTEPEVPGLEFINFMKTGKKGSGDNGYIFAAPLQYSAVLRGSIPAGVDEFSIKGSVPNPALFTVQYFTSQLNKAGVKISGNAEVAEAKLSYEAVNNFYTVVSPPLKDMVFIINKRSFNLYTEMLMRTIGGEKGKEFSSPAGIKVVEDYLKNAGIDISGLQLFDGCGLSRSNMVTTKLMSELLEHMTKTKYFEDYYNSFAVTGDPNDAGFYKSFGKGTEIEKNARIKSGLIEKVRSHSGYVKDRNGRMIVFSFIANNYKGNRRNIDAMHKKLMIELAKLK